MREEIKSRFSPGNVGRSAASRHKVFVASELSEGIAAKCTELQLCRFYMSMNLILIVARTGLRRKNYCVIKTTT